MGFFGNRAEKRAKADATLAESERLAALPVHELAAEALAAFGREGMKIKSGHRAGAVEVVSWLLPDAPARDRAPTLGHVIEALGVLEHANLLTRRSFGTKGQASTYRITTLGEAALAEGTARERLGIREH